MMREITIEVVDRRQSPRRPSIGVLWWWLMLFLAIAGLAHAQPSAEPKKIMGGGVESCGAWLQHRRTGGSTDMQWALGYLSGIAIWSDANPLRGTDGDGVWYWLDN
jgi:hypothetical protein